MNNFPDYKKSYPQILSNVSHTAKILILNDLKLMREELKKLGKDVGGQTKKLAIYGYMALISVPPLLISAIIGLGILLEGRYWLSALLVGLTLMIVGVVGVHYAFKKLTRINFKLTKTSEALKREGEVIYRQFSKLQEMASNGDLNGGQRAAN